VIRPVVISAAVASLLSLAACQTTGGSTTASLTGGTPSLVDPLDRLIDKYETSGSVYEIPDMKAGVQPLLTSDEAGLWLMFDKFEATAKTSGQRLIDPALHNYVSQLVCKLAGPYCPDVRVYVMRVPEFNASMAPNGMMNVFSGLLLRAHNEAQLSMVIGHEIGHFVRRHSIQRMRDMSDKAAFHTFFSIAMGAVGIPAMSDIAYLGIMGSISAFSRDHEREADKFGVLFMRDHNYDITEGAKIWENLIRELDALGDDRPTRSFFFASHPPPDERAKTLNLFADKLQGPAFPAKDNRDAYRAVIGKHRHWMLEDEIRQRRPKRTLELIKILIADGYNVGELKFFEGEVYRLRNDKDEDDLNNAVSAYHEAKRLGGYPAKLHRSLGIVYRRLDRIDDARDELGQYLRLMPDAPDAPFIRQMLKPVG